MTIKLDHIDHIALNVTDMERSIRFYCDVLGFEHRHPGIWGGEPALLFIGETGLAIFEAESAEQIKTGIRFLHLAFRATRQNFLDAQNQLKAQSIHFHFQDHEISHSIYFNDPDGHQLEITTYELE